MTSILDKPPVLRLGEYVDLSKAMPGTLVFCHSAGMIGGGIRLVQHIAGDDEWEVNHVAVLDRLIDGEWWVIQADAHGVTGSRNDGTTFHPRKLSEVAPGGWYVLVDPPPGTDVETGLAWLRGEVGDEYGFLVIASILATFAIPGQTVNVMLSYTWICSALAGEYLRAGGWSHRWADIYQVRPAMLRDALPEAA
jgi:hypothetical protein